MRTPPPSGSGWATVVRALFIAAALVVALWFLHEIRSVLLISFLAIVLSVVTNAPVTWLEDKGVNRVVGTLLVFGIVLAVVALLSLLVFPRVISESKMLVQAIPEYVSKLRDMAEKLLGRGSELSDSARDLIPRNVSEAGDLLPSAAEILKHLGQYSMSVLRVVVIVIVLVAMVGYVVVRPRPLLELYLRWFPERLRDAAARAFTRASEMCVGWMWSNIIAGILEAGLVALVLGLLGVRGAVVWAALAFFSELIPTIGAYIMALPPLLVALADSPTTALWVALFYIAMNEVVGNFVIPKIRALTMDLHASSVLFMMLVMAGAFGLAGALIATPVFVKVYFEEFYIANREPLAGRDGQIQGILRRAEPPED